MGYVVLAICAVTYPLDKSLLLIYRLCYSNEHKQAQPLSTAICILFDDAIVCTHRSYAICRFGNLKKPLCR
jgi:hypothetical protein